MAIGTFSREALDRIVANSTAEKLRFKDKKTALVDIGTASIFVQALNLVKGELGDKMLHGASKSPQSLATVVAFIRDRMG